MKIKTVTYNYDKHIENKLVSGAIHRHLTNKIRKETKLPSLIAVITLIYGNEFWAMGKRQ